jgi:hypothetical protein
MLLLLVDRIEGVDETVRARLVTLMLRFAVRGIRRAEVLRAPIIAVRSDGNARMEAPEELALRASAGGGVLPAVEPGAADGEGWDEPVVVATAEERSLLAELLGVHVERAAGSSRRGLTASLGEVARRLRRALRRLAGRRPLAVGRLGRHERRLVEAASVAGVEIALAEGGGEPVRRGGTTVLGRRRPEVGAAARVVAADETWLYPALLATVDEDLEIPDRVRDGWVASVAAGPHNRRGGFDTRPGSVADGPGKLS